MISLEQVQLLETKVAKAIEYVQRVNSENTALLSERTGLQKKLDANQKRLDELELLVMRFKEDQGRIEDGIVAALDRLSQFEEAFETSLKEKTTPKKTQAKKEKAPEPESNESSDDSKEFFEISAVELQESPPETEDGNLNSNSEDSNPEDSNPEDDDQEDEDTEDDNAQDEELDIF